MVEDTSMSASPISPNSSKWKQALLIGACSFFVALLNSSLQAQSATRDITGIVTDQNGEPLRRAVVQIDDEETKVVFSYITDRGGKFTFKRVNGSDDYRIWATRKGHRSKAIHLSPFDSHQSKAITLIVRFQ